MNLSQQQEPIPVTIDLGVEKLQGFIMKLTRSGVLVELDKIPFKVGSYVVISFSLDDKSVVTEKVRSIKHYDRFFRTPKKKTVEPGDEKILPKKLCELHFQNLTEANRVIISKYIIQLNVALGRK
jgi:hypothetical protein